MSGLSDVLHKGVPPAQDGARSAGRVGHLYVVPVAANLVGLQAAGGELDAAGGGVEDGAAEREQIGRRVGGVLVGLLYCEGVRLRLVVWP